MTRMIAFLRGINVGGSHKVPMAELSALFASLGFGRVQTLLNTGNVLFDAPDDADGLPTVIEDALRARWGFEIPVALVTVDGLRGALANDPFGGKSAAEHVKLYLAVLFAPPAREPSLPNFTPTKEGDVEILRRDGMLVFTAGYEKDGRFGFPNAAVEKLYGVPATTRNSNTIEKLLQQHP